MSKPTPTIGVCRFCGCTDQSPCRLADGETCVWMNRLRTVCSKWSCAQARFNEEKRMKRGRQQELRQMRGRLIQRLRDEREAKRNPGKPKHRKGRDP